MTIKFALISDSNGTEIYESGAANVANIVAAETGYTALNASFSGDTTAEMYARLAADVYPAVPDLAIIQGGTNNMADAYTNNVTDAVWIPAWLDPIEDMVTGLRAQDILPFVCSPPPSKRVEEAVRWPKAIRALKQLCDDLGVPYIPLHEKVSAKALYPSQYLALFRSDPDMYHFTSAGHALWADTILPFLLVDRADTTAFATVLNVTPASSFGSISNKTIKVAIPAAALTNVPVGVRSKVRVTLKASAAESWQIAAAYIGHRVSGAQSSGLAQLKESGGSGAFTVAQNSTLEVTADFAYNGSSDLMLQIASPTTSNDAVIADNAFTGAVTYLNSSGNQANVTSASGFTGYSSYLSGFTKLEINGA